MTAKIKIVIISISRSTAEAVLYLLLRYHIQV